MSAAKGRTIFLTAIIIITALHIFASVWRMPNQFESEPGAGPFGGIRLHYLKVWNFDFSRGVFMEGGTSHLLDNFIKSAVSGTHGLIDFMHWYIYIGIYEFLGVPINEFWLLFAQTITMIFALLLLCLLIAKLYDSRSLALVFMFICAQVYIHYSRSFYVIPANTLMEVLLLGALYYYNRGPSGPSLKIALAFLIFLNSASGNIIKLPLYLLFAWCANYKINGLNALRASKEFLLKKPSNLLFVIPVLAAVLGHFYVFSRIGESNLGMLGWISQKMGFGAASFSKWALINQALEKILFRGYFAWWVVIIIAVFYVLLVLRGARKAPLLLFPFIYYLYLINFEPHSATLGLVLVMSIGIRGAFTVAKDIKEERVRRLSYVFAAIFSLYALFNLTGATIYSVAKRRPLGPNYLKAIGLFLRDNMVQDDRIASLLSQTDNILNEYYYGKAFFRSPVFGKGIYDYRNLSCPKSLDNPVTPEEVNREFAFYVLSSQTYKEDAEYARFFDRLVKKYSLKKVADIAQGDEIYASVYSSRSLDYVRVNAEKANSEFDRRYANLKNLFYNHHVGVASTWGNY